MKVRDMVDYELSEIKESFKHNEGADESGWVMLIKVAGVVLILLMLLYNVNGSIAISDNNDRAYYNLTNGGNEATGRTGDLTSLGSPTSVTGIIGNAYEFNGTANSQFKNTSNVVVTSYPFTLNAWVNYSEIKAGVNDNAPALAIGAGSGFNPYYTIIVYRGKARSTARPAGAGEFYAESTTNITGLGWVMLTAVYNNNTDRRIYVNGVNEANDTASAVFSAGVDTVTIGGNADGNTDQFFFGGVDEASIWNKSLSSAEIEQLYASGAGCTWSFSTCITSPTIVTNLTNGTTYTNKNISVQLTATEATNMSVSVNGSAFTLVAIDSTSHITQLNLSENTNTLSFKSETVGGVVYTNLTVIVDTIAPTLSVTSYTRWNISYTFTNFGNTINFTEANLDTCNVTTDESKTFDCTNSSYTFATVGNHTFNVSINDTAGRRATVNNSLIYINPIQQFQFNDTNNNVIVSNFTFAGVTTTGNAVRIEADDFSNGVHQLNFTKVGYIPTTYSVTFNDTMKLNETFNVREAQIIVTIKDRKNLSTISGENFTLEFIGTTGFVATTSNGTRTITGLLASGNYELFLTSENFTTEFKAFTFTEQEQLNITIYSSLANASDTGSVIIKVVDVDGQPIPDVTTTARQWNTATSSYISVSEDTTINDGTSTLNIILNTKQYVFRAVKGNAQVDSVEQIITTVNDGKTITLTLGAGTGSIPPYLFQGTNYNTTYSFNSSTNISTVSFEWYNINGISVTACVNGYRRQNGQDILLSGSLNCTSASSGEIIRSFAINTTYDTYVLKAEFQKDSELYTVKSYYVYSDDSLFKQLENYQIHYFILIFLHIMSIAVGLTLQNIYIGTIGLILSSLIATVIAPTLMTTSIAVFLTFIGVVTLLGGIKE